METIRLYSVEDGLAKIEKIIEYQAFIEDLCAHWNDGPTVDEQISELETKISALESRKYKRNGTIITMGNEDGEFTDKSIYAINCARKRKNINALYAELEELRKYKASHKI